MKFVQEFDDYINEMKITETTQKSQIPGVYYVSKTIGSSKYLKAIHEKSGRPIVNFSDGRIKKIRENIKLIDSMLAELEWDIPMEQLTKEHAQLALKIQIEVKQ